MILRATTDCECLEPGWCERHRCRKTAHEIDLCAARPDYFQLWEDGRGPGQVGDRDDVRPGDVVWTSQVGPLHAYFHVWPVAGNGVWEWNVQQFLQRIELFDGRRIVGIATSEEAAPPEAVMATLDGHGCEFVVRPNDPELRETISMTPAFECLRDEPGATLVCHAKGVTRRTPTVREWARLAWSICCDHHDLVTDRLARHAIVGPFRKNSGFDRPGTEGWHYHGGFYWVRNESVRERGAVPEAVWHGSESFPGRWFAPEEGGVLLFDLAEQDVLYGHATEHCSRRYQSWKRGRNRSRTSSSTT